MRNPSPAMLVAIAALLVALGGVGVAATGGNLILGQSNTAGAKTSLTAGMSDRALAITNLNKGSSATALGLNVDPSRPPLIVNSSTKVANLNADKLDGKDSGSFLAKAGKAADADKLDGLDSTELSPAKGAFRTDDLPLTISVQPVVTASITTARLSLLTLSAAVGVTNTTTSVGGVQCFVTIDGVGTNESFTTYTGSLATTLPVVWVQAVEAGPHTVELECKGASYLYVDTAMMSVTAHLYE